jgi:hypothetical protein
MSYSYYYQVIPMGKEKGYLQPCPAPGMEGRQCLFVDVDSATTYDTWVCVVSGHNLCKDCIKAKGYELDTDKSKK